MNDKTKQLITLIYKKLKSHKEPNIKISKKEVEELISYFIYSN